MELVIVLAVGAAFARDQLSNPLIRNRLSFAPGSEWVRLIGGSTVSGMALAGGVCLLFEARRRRPPSSWGIGRWIWSISAVSVVLSVGFNLATGLIYQLQATGRPPAAWYLLNRFRGFVGIALSEEFVWALTALCFTSWLARSPADPRPDAREWAGRVFGSLVVATTLATRALQVAGG